MKRTRRKSGPAGGSKWAVHGEIYPNRRPCLDLETRPSAYQFPIAPAFLARERALDCPPRGETEKQGGVERKGGRVSRSRPRRILQSLGVLGCNWRGRIMECCQWAQRAMAGRVVPRLKRPEGWGGTWSGQSSLRSEGGQNVFIPFHPSHPFLSDQECLSRLEWFIPSISGDYFIYRSWEGGTPTPSGRRATLRRVSSHQHHVSLGSPSSFLSPNSAKDLQGSSPPPSLLRGCLCSAFPEPFRKLPDPFEFLTRQLPLRGHKGSYFLNSSATRIPSGVYGVIYGVYIYRFIPPDRGPNIFVEGGETRFDPLRFRSIFNAIVDGETRIDVFFFFFIYWGEDSWIGVSLFLENIRWKSIGIVEKFDHRTFNWSIPLFWCLFWFCKCRQHSILNFALFSLEWWLKRFLIFRSISSFDLLKHFHCCFH